MVAASSASIVLPYSVNSKLACLLLSKHMYGNAGEQGVLHAGWQRHAEAVSTALHPDVDQLVVLLNRLATGTEPILNTQSSELRDHIDAILVLPACSAATLLCTSIPCKRLLGSLSQAAGSQATM